jgi:hypothetical protein
MYSDKSPGAGVQLNLRIDEELRRQLADAAKRSVRSLNGEIVNRLRSSFGDDGWLAGKQRAGGVRHEQPLFHQPAPGKEKCRAQR